MKDKAFGKTPAEAASVLALLQTALVLVGYIGARLLLGRIPGQSAV